MTSAFVPDVVSGELHLCEGDDYHFSVQDRTVARHNDVDPEGYEAPLLIEHGRTERAELVNAARGYDFHNSDVVETDILSAFLAPAALEAGEGQAEAWEDCVQ